MSDTAAAVNAQKAALLAAIAQQGSQGAVALKAEQERRAAASQAAAQQVAASAQGTALRTPTALTQGLAQQAAALDSVYAQDAASAGQAFNNSIAQTSAANSAYMNQAAAAVPVVEAQTAGTIAQIRAQQEQDRLDRQEAAAQRAHAELMRQYDLEDRRAAEVEDKTAGAKDYLTGEQDKARTSVVKEALRANEDLGGWLAQVVDSSESLEQAVPYAQNVVKQWVADYNAQAKESGDPTVDEETAREYVRRLQGYVYRYYTNAKKAGNSALTLGLDIQRAGGNPDAVPGYADSLRQHLAGLVNKPFSNGIITLNGG